MRIFIASRAVLHDCACAIIGVSSSIQATSFLSPSSYIGKHLFTWPCKLNCEKRVQNYDFIVSFHDPVSFI